jgi:uncharacterized membrane protein YfcA
MSCLTAQNREHILLEAATDIAAATPILAILGFYLLDAAPEAGLEEALPTLIVAALGFWFARSTIWNVVCKLSSHEGCFVYMFSGRRPRKTVSRRALVLTTGTFGVASVIANIVLLLRT